MKVFICAMVLLLVLPRFQANGQNPPYLSDFPTVDEVIQKINGDNDFDSYTMRVGAFQHLNELIDKLSGYNLSRKLTEDEKNLKETYRTATRQLRSDYHNNIQSLSGELEKKWIRQCFQYTSKLAPQIEENLLGPKANVKLAELRKQKQIAIKERKKADSAKTAKLEKTLADADEENEIEQRTKLMRTGIMGICFGGGVLLLLAAFRLGHKLQRYEFENRTDGGVVEFPSYEASLRHHRRKVYSKIMYGAAVILLILGVMALTNT